MLRDINDIGLAAILAVAVLLAGSAGAARAGAADDCCADLEARVAELEATTARKGNRTVSVTVSGWANEALFAWDDGTEFDAYLGTNVVEQSRVKFVGAAKITEEWSVGFLLEIGIQGHVGNQWDQTTLHSLSANPANGDDRPFVRKNYWFLKSSRLGEFSFGLNGMATYHLLDDADPTFARDVDDAEGAPIFMAGFLIRSDGNFVNNLRWREVLRGFNNSTPGDASRRNVFRYQSPEWNGLVVTTSLGDDDVWDAAVTYKQTFLDFSVLARAGYGASNNPGSLRSTPQGNYAVGGTPCISGGNIATSLPNFSCTWEGAAATITHDPTGLFVFGGWGRQSVRTDHVFPPGTVFEPDSTTWFVRPGVQKQWFRLGATEIFVSYRHDDPGSNPDKTVSGNINFWQGGLIQRLDEADMNLYVVYQYADGSFIGNSATATSGAPIGETSIDGFQQVITGAKIDF